MNTNNKQQQYEMQIVDGKFIYVENTQWGWFVQVSDGYTSDYFETKKEASARRSEIKKAIKEGWW